MTVAELIEKLKALPQDMTVAYYNDGWVTADVVEVDDVRSVWNGEEWIDTTEVVKIY